MNEMMRAIVFAVRIEADGNVGERVSLHKKDFGQ